MNVYTTKWKIKEGENAHKKSTTKNPYRMLTITTLILLLLLLLLLLPIIIIICNSLYRLRAVSKKDSNVYNKLLSPNILLPTPEKKKTKKEMHLSVVYVIWSLTE